MEIERTNVAAAHVISKHKCVLFGLWVHMSHTEALLLLAFDLSAWSAYLQL